MIEGAIREAVAGSPIRTAQKQEPLLQTDCCGTKPSMSSSSTSDPKQRTGSGALFAGGLAAILASTCCLGPLLLVALGFSGAWIGNLTRLEPYRPYFLLGAVIALAFAARHIFRPANACEPGELCAATKARRLYQILFGAAVLLVLVAFVFPYFAKYFY